MSSDSSIPRGATLALNFVTTALAFENVARTSTCWRCESVNCRAVKYVSPAIDADSANAPRPNVTVNLALSPSPAHGLRFLVRGTEARLRREGNVDLRWPACNPY